MSTPDLSSPDLTPSSNPSVPAEPTLKKVPYSVQVLLIILLVIIVMSIVAASITIAVRKCNPNYPQFTDGLIPGTVTPACKYIGNEIWPVYKADTELLYATAAEAWAAKLAAPDAIGIAHVSTFPDSVPVLLHEQLGRWGLVRRIKTSDTTEGEIEMYISSDAGVPPPACTAVSSPSGACYYTGQGFMFTYGASDSRTFSSKEDAWAVALADPSARGIGRSAQPVNGAPAALSSAPWRIATSIQETGSTLRSSGMVWEIYSKRLF